MERHLQHGTVNHDIVRPSADILKRYEQHDVAKIADAMARHGIMHHEIKPISPGMRLLGPAVTVLTRPGDALYVAHSADVAQPGDIIVIDAGGQPNASVIGERIAEYMQQQRGIAGLVVDGAVRDVKGLRDMEFPTFTRGVTPRLFGASGPGAINVTISCGGVTVNPGDLIVGDDDGVVVVPGADVERVLELADEHLAGELHRLGLVNSGQSLTEVQDLLPRLQAWRAELEPAGSTV